ncbi:MAG TPA: DNA ligase D [Methylophilus sp.]|uniref:DNA ligase D n=1 Tax=Methylophilus sp. TaxID=29541 RepID=UPI002BBB453D|nr:DNA ligase D [Methylophilus sp.]HSH87206.1 DNA ligase D [Methylophilus sp.]
MGLQQYWKKRDFKITREPRGQVESPGEQLRFFIQKHHARRLHYDFRLEFDGTLKSWAVPKGPSLDPADKRLAVEVEDHPLAYGTFEGDIPSGQYGAGHVMLWDKGTWEAIGDPVTGYKNGSIKFKLHGHKLEGKWALVRMKTRQADKDDKINWLLIKEHDEHARTGAGAQITNTAQASVSELPDNHDHQHDEGASPEIQIPANTTPTSIPEKCSPQLATLASKVPDGEQWLVELKYDGYRALTRIKDGKARMLTRNGHDWSAKWPALAEALSALPVDTAWLDGEVVAIGPDGNVSFQLLQNAMRLDKEAKLIYFVFDLMYLDGHDLTKLPLINRKDLLRTLLAKQGADSLIHFSDHITGQAVEVFKQACLHGQEGIVVKDAQGTYVQNRSADWLKVKCGLRQEFVIAGYTDPAGSRERFGALLLGLYDEAGKLRYAGRVGTGFNADSLNMIAGHLPKLKMATPAFANPPTGREAQGVHWLKPSLVAEVKFAQWTSEGLTRHASFIGLRSDKPAKEIIHEAALAPEDIESKASKEKNAEKKNANNTRHTGQKTSTQPLTDSASGSQVAGIKLTHPAKVLYAGDGYTKMDIARHYANIEQWILPYLEDRPLSIVRCPDGYQNGCFFQKHVTRDSHRHLQSVQLDPASKDAEYFIASTLPAMIELVQLGVLELHSWGSRYPVTALADRLIFDLDPAPELSWDKVTEAALLLKGLLEEVDLTCFVKTTGGKGLHVEVPIKPEYPWQVVKAFSRDIARYLEKHIPDRFTSSISKKKREGKIFIDYLRNGSGATAIVPYSTRARAGAPVATPLFWDEVGADIHSDIFNITNIGERLSRQRSDPWKDYLKIRQKLSPTLLKLFSP